MPNIKTAIKRVKVNDKKRVQNTAQKSAFRTSIKNFEVAVDNKDVEQAAIALGTATKYIDKSVTKGLIKKNKAARKKSQIARKYNELVKEEAETETA